VLEARTDAEALGIPAAGTDSASVQRAFRSAARETHPDRGGDGPAFRKLREAADREARRAAARERVEAAAEDEVGEWVAFLRRRADPHAELWRVPRAFRGACRARLGPPGAASGRGSSHRGREEEEEFDAAAARKAFWARFWQSLGWSWCLPRREDHRYWD